MLINTIILVVHVCCALGVIGLVLIQHGQGADAGAAFGSGSSQSLFGSRGAGTFLTKLTALLATMFFITSLSLAYFSGQSVPSRSVTDQIEQVMDDETIQGNSGPSGLPVIPE